MRYFALIFFTSVVACSSEPEPNPVPMWDAAVGPSDGGPPGLGCVDRAPAECTQPELRYDDVAPIIEARCLSCHDGQHGQWPLTSYRHVADWFDELRGVIVACTMPPPDADIPMEREERELILNWLICGYPQ